MLSLWDHMFLVGHLRQQKSTSFLRLGLSKPRIGCSQNISVQERDHTAIKQAPRQCGDQAAVESKEAFMTHNSSGCCELRLEQTSHSQCDRKGAWKLTAAQAHWRTRPGAAALEEKLVACVCNLTFKTSANRSCVNITPYCSVKVAVYIEFLNCFSSSNSSARCKMHRVFQTLPRGSVTRLAQPTSSHAVITRKTSEATANNQRTSNIV